MMKRKLAIIAIFMILGVVAGCGDGDTPPDLDRTNTLGGIDANNNGIRDDIERWIAAQPITNDKKLALSQFAKSMQEAILVDASKDAMVRAVAARGGAAVKCIVLRGPDKVNGADTISTIQKYTANTKARVVAYFKFNQALNDTSSQSPLGDGCAH